MDKEILVFVYGTLRKMEVNSHLLIDSTRIADQCWTHGLLYDTGLGYPAMKESTIGKVHGELYAIHEKQLPALDELEDYFGPGEKNLYNRIKKKVFTDTDIYQAYVYTIHPENESILLKPIDSGDWKVFRLQNLQT